VLLTVPADEEGVYLKPEMSARVAFLKVSSAGQGQDGPQSAADPARQEARK
jgi:hypothetical protein